MNVFDARIKKKLWIGNQKQKRKIVKKRYKTWKANTEQLNTVYSNQIQIFSADNFILSVNFIYLSPKKIVQQDTYFLLFFYRNVQILLMMLWLSLTYLSLFFFVFSLHFGYRLITHYLKWTAILFTGNELSLFFLYFSRFVWSIFRMLKIFSVFFFLWFLLNWISTK